MLITSGNSDSKNFTLGVNASRKEGNNKLALDGHLAYGSSDILVVGTDPTTGATIVDRERVTSTNNWAAKGRYDRFLTSNNTLFVGALAAGDQVAGKSFFGGGDIGYSRQLFKNKWHIVVSELGYDFSYQRYVRAGLDPVEIHSARVLVGETLSLSKETGIIASAEGLFNLNRESKAVNASSNDASLGVAAFKDTRINGKIGLTTSLWSSLSFGFTFTVRYDENPAPRPNPPNAPSTFAGYSPTSSFYLADKVDTLTEATLIYTFF